MKQRFISLFLLAFSHGLSLIAQDANYWSSDYGPGGFLTPGAVIAYNRDSGVLFFNPALLAYTNKSSASITGNIYQYESIRIKDAVGAGLPLSSTGGSIIPQMGAGSIAIHGSKPFVIGYALIRNPVSSFQATQRKDAKQNVLNDSYSPGPEYYVGQYSLANSITETSGILSAGLKLTSALSVGLSVEGQIRKQTYSEDFSSRALYNTGTDTLFPPVASATYNYLATYTHIGVRFKGGLSYNAAGHHAGLLISSPLLHILGRSTLYADNEVNDLRIADNLNLNLLANTRQTGLGARWKSPVSLALGYAYDYSSSGQIYFVAEYFARVSNYNIITPRSDYFLRPDTGDNNSNTTALLKLRDAHKALVNFAIGLSFPVTPAVLGYCSFRTDFSYADRTLSNNEDGFAANTSYWNNWHLQLGANFKKRKFNLRPGLLLSYGTTSKYMQPVNFDNPSEVNTLLGDPHPVRASRFSAGLMLSYIHNL
ncbi:MAG TPA: hypothetical protein VNS58_22595 [Puia sp.]|nr:hypothetical protein [Puia sp.]